MVLLTPMVSVDMQGVLFMKEKSGWQPLGGVGVSIAVTTGRIMMPSGYRFSRFPHLSER